MPKAATRSSIVPQIRTRDGRVDLRSLSRSEIEALAIERGLSRAQGRGLFQALWTPLAGALPVFASLPSAARVLADTARCSELRLTSAHDSSDGARKLLWDVGHGQRIESVLIPDGERLTLCVSTQVGCAMACAFCVTGDMGLSRHLTPAEIALQPALANTLLPAGRRITNIVMMGMGEPLHNLDNLMVALDIILDDHGLGFSHRRITVSTVGIVSALKRLASTCPVNIAVSLNATTDAQRTSLMPVNRRWNIATLLSACRSLPRPARKRIVFEFVMIDGHNSSATDADRLASLLDGLPCKLNLIPYNENPGRLLRRPSDATIETFRARLAGAGIPCTVRRTRGQDIAAACGQLGRVAALARSPLGIRPGEPER